MHYVPHVDYAFFSVEHIMRDVNSSWFFRLCVTLGTDEFLGGYCYYKFIFSCTSFG